MIDHLTSAEVAWVSVVLISLLAFGWYLSLSAARLDRLHHRAESSFAALRTQLVRRAAIAVEAASVVDPAAGLVLASAASAALGPWGEDRPWDDTDAQAQNDLTRALDDVFGDPGAGHLAREDALARDTLVELGDACARVQIARRFHNDAVAAAQRRRRKRVVRWARLAGYAPMPAMVDFDDTVPAGVSRKEAWRRPPEADADGDPAVRPT